MVFFFHVVQDVPTNTLWFGAKWFIRIAQHGYNGVTIFFVLSGFLITNRYVQNIELTGTWFKRYLLNRWARIYPIYFLLTVVAFVLMIFYPAHVWYEWPATFRVPDKVAAIFLNLTLTRSFFDKMKTLGLPTSWSLTIEETFYLFAPFLLLGLKRNLHRFFIYPILLLCIGALAVGLARFIPYYGLMATLDFMLKWTFFGRCIDFFIGIGLAFIIKRNSTIIARSTWLGVAGILLTMTALAILVQNIPGTSQTYFIIDRFLNALLLPSCSALLFAGLIYERTWLQRILQTRIFDLLGKSSYVFYLIHIGAIDTLFTSYVSHNWIARLVAYTLLSIVLYKWVEHPLNKVFRAKPLANNINLSASS